jgi:hypothetical protein
MPYVDVALHSLSVILASGHVGNAYPIFLTGIEASVGRSGLNGYTKPDSDQVRHLLT